MNRDNFSADFFRYSRGIPSTPATGFQRSTTVEDAIFSAQSRPAIRSPEPLTVRVTEASIPFSENGILSSSDQNHRQSTRNSNSAL